MMYRTLLLSSSLFILHVMGTPHVFAHHGRRVCSGGGGDGRDLRRSVVVATESYVQPVHKPYITLCQGHRLCSTYKTTYSVSYRQVSRTASSARFYAACCPGWRRFHSHNCNHALCGEPCVNGGSCIRPDQCACAPGWTGQRCQADVDECGGRPPCAQRCVNTPGSFRCACGDGFGLAGDGRSCQRLRPPLHLLPEAPPSPPPPPPPTPPPAPPQSGTAGTGGPTDAGERFENVTAEVQILRNRVELLEKKLQLVLAPFSSFFPPSLDDGVSEKTSLLSHSFQQLDRIDSLSEQIGFLEERLGTCSCQEN